MNISDAAKDLTGLVNKVCAEGVSVDLERDNMVVARLMPVAPKSTLTIGELNAFLSQLPSLGDDAEQFAKDIRLLRAEIPAEEISWD